MARDAVLHRTRAGGARTDRGRHPAHRRARRRRRLRPRRRAVRRQGTGRADLGDHRDQRLEQAGRHRPPVAAVLTAGGRCGGRRTGATGLRRGRRGGRERTAVYHHLAPRGSGLPSSP
ncbi:hypothetical protein SCOCK_90199 [Actinacidiphila cocklensis]|uniref:Uncharacterized protein n=1 Tax=Actinacidiphila cocklensis TaxID=887465 RepID=A0A9W4E4V5_9ACTN|nr:hypothetical protein SCOCK_90199 [Actinacidiphila cocklensis]